MSVCDPCEDKEYINICKNFWKFSHHLLQSGLQVATAGKLNSTEIQEELWGTMLFVCPEKNICWNALFILQRWLVAHAFVLGWDSHMLPHPDLVGFVILWWQPPLLTHREKNMQYTVHCCGCGCSRMVFCCNVSITLQMTVEDSLEEKLKVCTRGIQLLKMLGYIYEASQQCYRNDLPHLLPQYFFSLNLACSLRMGGVAFQY